MADQAGQMQAVLVDSLDSRWGPLKVPRAYAERSETNIRKLGWQVAYEAGFREAVARAEDAADGGSRSTSSYKIAPAPPIPFTSRIRPAGWALLGAAVAAVPLTVALIRSSRKVRRVKRKLKKARRR